MIKRVDVTYGAKYPIYNPRERAKEILIDELGSRNDFEVIKATKTDLNHNAKYVTLDIIADVSKPEVTTDLFPNAEFIDILG